MTNEKWKTIYVEDHVYYKTHTEKQHKQKELICLEGDKSFENFV